MKYIVNKWVYGALILLFAFTGGCWIYADNINNRKANKEEIVRVESRIDLNCEKIDKTKDLIHENTVILGKVEILLESLKDKK